MTDIEEKTAYSKVNHPNHYNQGKLEVIKALEGLMTSSEYEGFLVGNVIKYISRYKYKGTPEEDISKAIFYLTELKRFFHSQQAAVASQNSLNNF